MQLIVAPLCLSHLLFECLNLFLIPGWTMGPVWLEAKIAAFVQVLQQIEVTTYV